MEGSFALPYGDLKGSGSKAWQEACGLFGLYGPGQPVARLTYYGLFALQHRGQESAGIAVADGQSIRVEKGMGWVAEVFNRESLESLQGHIAVGHTRYAPKEENIPMNTQPLVFRYLHGMMAIAHNGRLLNSTQLRQELGRSGVIFQTTTDSELIANFIAKHNQRPLGEALLACQKVLKGGYSLLVMTERELAAMRDPFGFRPLCLGRIGQGWVLASESCALDTVGAEFWRDVEPGEVVVIGHKGPSFMKGEICRRAHCAFEYIYFARPDSILDGESVIWVRRRSGQELAREYRPEADLVLPVPDSGIAAAAGYAEEAGLPFIEGLMKNRYVGRTFIQPSQDMRDLSVRLKLNPIASIVKNKRVILVDDSLVRGTTSRNLVSMLRQAGVKEVHLLLASPPVKYPCPYGINTGDPQELIAARLSPEEIREYVGADSLYYLSLEGLGRAFHRLSPGDLCTACFDGRYPAS